jgi:CBS domain containing-hemolysin-like protein
VISLGVVFAVAAVCVLTEAFFSGTEMAMVSVNRARLRQRAGEGERGAQLVEQLLARPQVMLATTLLGTNLGTVTFSVTVALYLVGSQADSGELLAIGVVTPTTLLFGEMVPKTLFQQYADQLAPRLAYPLTVASLILRPAVWVMSGMAGFMSRLLGIERERAFVTREELALLIEGDGSPRSEIKEHEREMIANVLDLTDQEVGDVMVPLSEVTALPEDTTVAEAIAVVADKQHSRMPIYRSRVDDIVGVLHAFDMLQVPPSERERPVGELARQVRFVPTSQRAVDLLVELQGTGKQMAVVVDEYGGAIGVVTIEDILEEIVGEIEDEYDAEEPSPFVQERPGVWRVQARTSVERLNQELRLNLPEGEDYESLGGLILDQVKRIPAPGETIVIEGITLRVLTGTDRAIGEVQLLKRRR